MNINTAEQFLERCKSSTETYKLVKEVLQGFQNKDSRDASFKLMTLVRKYFEDFSSEDDFLKQYHFCFKTISLGPNLPTMQLLQLPSIFSPEEWSFTFFEGLSRLPKSKFEDEDMVELGCGNGWITIALAMRNSPRKIYGLDINPKSIVCAQINLYLNSYNAEGNVIFDAHGRPLWDRVEFHESNLLAHLLEKNVKLDRVVGCIPQVLAPDPQALLDKATESDSDQALYDLSNYTEAHGYLEDQFGLGLIAKALEESVQCLRPSGSIIFNLGGRPGVSVLEGVFLRRGFHMKKLWSTRVEQAGDTDIQALVEIEANSQHRFEFYMGRNSNESISAKTAQAYGQAGGAIAHDLSVYEAEVPAHEQISKILDYLGRPENKALHDALDLSSNDREIYLERVRFLAYLAEVFSNDLALPYGETQGLLELRNNIAGFIKVFFKVPMSHEHVLVCPSRSDVIVNFLKTYAPQTILFDQSLLTELFPKRRGLQQCFSGDLIEAPKRIDLVVDLIETLKPDLLVTSLTEFENESHIAFEELIKASQEHKVQLILDISEYFDLSSQPANNAALNFMAQYPLPKNVSLICGLVKNRVYSDLQLSFLITENEKTISQLCDAAELTYSRTPLLAQHYYNKILADLLGFHMLSARGINEKCSRADYHNTSNIEELNLSATAELAFSHPSIKRNALKLKESTVRLDYGENCLPIPKLLADGVYEAFVRRKIAPSACDPAPEVKAFMNIEYGLSIHSQSIVYGSGVAPLFAKLLTQMAANNEVLIFPKGCYGEFVAAAQYFGVKVIHCETEENNQFKLGPELLHQSLTAVDGRAWVFINGPIVNPTGACYSGSELQELFNVIRAHKAYSIIDSTFSGLHFGGDNQKTPLNNTLGQRDDWVFLGSASKLFAAGGLRFGFAISKNPAILQSLQSGLFAPPHDIIKYAMKKLFQKYLAEDPALVAGLSQQRLLLGQRAKTLSTCLKDCGWSVLSSGGGLFLVAKPDSYIGKSFKASTDSGEINYKIDGTTISKAYFEHSDLLINGADWTGLPHYCRFVLSVSEADFQNSLKAIKDFHQEFLKQNP